MSVASSRDTTQRVAAIAATLALGWLLLAPVGQPQAIIAAALALIATIGAWRAVLVKHTFAIPAAWAVAAAVVLVVGALIKQQFGWPAIVGLILLLASAAALAYAARPALPKAARRG